MNSQDTYYHEEGTDYATFTKRDQIIHNIVAKWAHNKLQANTSSTSSAFGMV
jgi:hypothetical protein